MWRFQNEETQSELTQTHAELIMPLQLKQQKTGLKETRRTLVCGRINHVWCSGVFSFSRWLDTSSITKFNSFKLQKRVIFFVRIFKLISVKAAMLFQNHSLISSG